MFQACIIGKNPDAFFRLVSRTRSAHYFQHPIQHFKDVDALPARLLSTSFNLFFVNSDEVSIDQAFIYRIKRRYPKAHVVALASSPNITLLITLLKIGVEGFALYSSTRKDFHSMIWCFKKGGPFMSSQTMKHLLIGFSASYRKGC